MQNQVLYYQVNNHHGEKRIFLHFNYGTELEQIVRHIPGCRYSVSKRLWHIAFQNNPGIYYGKYLGNYILSPKEGGYPNDIPIKSKAITCGERNPNSKIKMTTHKVGIAPGLNSPKIRENRISHSEKDFNSNALASRKKYTTHIKKVFRPVLDKEETQEFEERIKEYTLAMQLKRLSPRTQEVYLEFFRVFAGTYKGRIKELDYRQLYSYIRKATADLGHTQRKQLIAAVKFYYEKYLNREKMFFNLGKIEDLPILPVTLNLHEIKKSMEKISSPHDRLLLFFAYHLNLTPRYLSELKANPDPPENCIPGWANNPASQKLLKELIGNHLLTLKPKEWLFEKAGQQQTALHIRLKVYRLLAYYQLKDIYRMQLKEGIEAYDYAPATRQQYVSFFMTFLEALGYKHPYFISKEEILLYLASLKEKSRHLQNSVINSLNFFFAKIYKKPLPEDWIPRPRKSLDLPDVFEREEIEAMLSTTVFKKHRLMFAIIYGGGLRRSELLGLKLEDVKLKKGLLFIRDGKGQKDRYTLLTPALKEWLEAYLEESRPVKYLFEGSKAGEPYTAASLTNALKTAAKRAGIHRRVHLHMLRHSFTTHLIEDGEDISVLQQLLGHSSIKTTQRYTHMANKALRQTRSPLENLSVSLKEVKFKPGSFP